MNKYNIENIYNKTNNAYVVNCDEYGVNNIFEYEDIILELLDCDISDFKYNENKLLIKNHDNTEIGQISISIYDDIYIELIDIYDEYQRKGYGTKTIQWLKEIARQFNISVIFGESRATLYDFYTKQGAVYENRRPGDEEYILNRFYIDID